MTACLLALLLVAPVATTAGATTTATVDAGTDSALADGAASGQTNASENDPPTVSIAREPEEPFFNETVNFTARAADPDGNVTGYRWVVNSDVAATERSFTARFRSVRLHNVTVIVRDDDGATASDTVRFNISTGNFDPQVSIFRGAGEPAPGESAQFIARGQDPDGYIVQYEWTVDGEAVSTDRILEYTFERPGTYEMRVEATDDGGEVATKTITVTVTRTPTPTAGSSPGLGVPLALGALVLVGVVRGSVDDRRER